MCLMRLLKKILKFQAFMAPYVGCPTETGNPQTNCGKRQKRRKIEFKKSRNTYAVTEDTHNFLVLYVCMCLFVSTSLLTYECDIFMEMHESVFFFCFVLILSLCVGVKYFCTRFWSKQPLAKSAFYKQQFYGYLCNKATKHVHKCNFAVTKRLSPFVFLCYLACT